MRNAACFARLVLILLAALCVAQSRPVAAAIQWTSPDHYRILFTVDQRGVTRTDAPAAVDIDFAQYLTNLGATGTFDEDTVEVFAYNGAGQAVVYDDASWRLGYEKNLLPWHLESYHGINRKTLSFSMPSNAYTQYAVYFDTVQSGMGKPERYHGLVGDGDVFTDGYQKREINANGGDAFCDFDGDGDLDLFKGGTEPYVYVYENVTGHSPTGNRYVSRGRLTSGGQVLKFETDGNNRSCTSIKFCDWDNDGDQDMFVLIGAPIRWRGPSEPPYRAPPGWSGGNSIQQVLIYENVTQPGGAITFVDRGPMRTQNADNQYIGYDMGAAVTFVDWDGDGRLDVLNGAPGAVTLYRNISPDDSLQHLKLTDGEFVLANGEPITIPDPKMDCGDLDGDGDMDMLVGICEGRVYYFENAAGPGSAPIFLQGRILAYYEFMDLGAGEKIYDFDGDGKLDFVVGRYWERTQWGEQPRFYGCLYKNVTQPGGPMKFEMKFAGEGSPYTEKFQQCDAVKQNGVRSVDWNNDGRTDLIASDTDGFVWFFENTTDQLYPIFKTGVKILSDGKAIRVYGEEDANRAAGYARVDVADWGSDGKKDLLVADGRGWLTLFKNIGTDAAPVFGPGERMMAYDNTQPQPQLHLIDGTGRASVLVCDWDNDGTKDLVFGMVGDWQYSEYADWPRIACTPLATGGYLSNDSGFLFYKNTGTNSNPALAYPSWIRVADGQLITYSSRPNLGSFVDWDGDGKKDFMAGEFENSARFYKNTGPNTSGALPVFATIWPGREMKDGLTVVQPDTVQMMSGVDALDWNRDGDLDIVTGQGHGASGLRFYERDYIDDYVNNTYPIVSAGSSSHGFDIAVAKLQQDGQAVTIPQGIVTAAFTDYFYVESEDRTSGIRVQKSSHGVSVGQRVDVTGAMATTSDGERYISATTITPNGSGSVTELGMGNRNAGGSSFLAGSIGQIGVTGGVGLNNIGLLVKTFGECTANLASTGDYQGNRFLFIDDGSGAVGWYRAIGGSYQQVAGVKVEVNDASIAVGDYVAARGACSMESINGAYQARILPRAGMGDVERL